DPREDQGHDREHTDACRDPTGEGRRQELEWTDGRVRPARGCRRTVGTGLTVAPAVCGLLLPERTAGLAGRRGGRVAGGRAVRGRRADCRLLPVALGGLLAVTLRGLRLLAVALLRGLLL